MKNVLILMSANSFYGAEQVLFEYLKNNNQHKFFIYTSDVVKKVIDSISNIEDVTVVSSAAMRVRSIRRKPMLSLSYILRNLFVIHRIVRENCIDVLYGNNTIDMVYVMLYRYFFCRSIGTICHVHDIVQRSMYHKMIRSFEKYIDAFITPSLAGKKSFVDDVADSNKIHVVYNGCSPNEIHDDVWNMPSVTSKDDGKKILLFIGQICERKRVDLFIQIVSTLNRNYAEKYVGYIVGGMEKNNNYVEKFKDDLNQSNIQYFGQVEHDRLYVEFFSRAAALILTSDRDPLPTVILEAMAVNVPVCARTVDGVPEMIEDNVSGVLWDYDASVETIAERIHTTLSDEDKVKVLKLNALKRIKEKFNPEKKKNFINKLIDEIHG